MNKNNLLRTLAILLFALLAQINANSMTTIAGITVTANPLPCDNGFYTLELTISYEEPNDEVFTIEIGGVDFGDFSYEQFPSGSTLTFNNLVANEEENVVVTVTDNGDIEVPCIGTTTYDEPLCCERVATCNLSDLFLEDCSLPAAFTEPEDVFIDIEPCNEELTMVSFDAGDFEICTDGDGADFVRTYNLFYNDFPVATCQQNIMVNDLTPPLITCPENQNLGCTDGTAPVATGMATATDNCTAADDIEITFADVSTQTVEGCASISYTIQRTWTATDLCGNFSTCVQTIEVQDNLPPFIVCPMTQNLDCTDATDPTTTGMATATDNCSASTDIDISFMDVSAQTSEGCGASSFLIERIWTATDICGNSSSCVQIINVSDTQAPVVLCPPNETLTCFENLPAPFNNAADFIAAGGSISDDCTTDVSAFTVFTSSESNGGNNCPGDARTVTRTYFIQDACLNTSTCTQTFTYLESTQAPVITAVLPTCYKYCASLNNPMEEDITFTTDCSFDATVNITGPTQIGQENCPGTIYRYTYIVTDDCGRTSLPVTRDFIIGNEGPSISCPPFNLILECGDPNNQEYINTHLATVTANTSCELGLLVNNNLPSNFASSTNCNTVRTVTFTATDDCGRNATCSSQITILDTTSPELTSAYVDGVCNEAVCGSDLNFFYSFWKDKVIEGLTATDNCDANVNIQALGPLSPNQNCPDGSSETVVAFVATDNCGNETQLEYSFFVNASDNPAPQGAILGTISTEASVHVENVSVNLEGNGSTWTNTTDVDGYFEFGQLEEGFNYEVTPYSDEDLLNGVSSYDLVLISKHILQIETLDSPYKIIAADVNNSGSITTMDLIDLRKTILFIEDGFPNNRSWRFVPADYIFPQSDNPFASIFPEVDYVNGLQSSEEKSFVATKIGDVNNSVVANSMAGSDSRNKKDLLHITIEDRIIKAGESFEITFSAADFQEVTGYQFTFEYDANHLNFKQLGQVSLPNLTAGNFGYSHLNEGLITTSWHHQEAISVPENAELFRLQFTAKATGKISDWVQISSEKTLAEAYRSSANSIELLDVGLRFSKHGIVRNEFTVFQNQPNPFIDETTIGFRIPEAGEVTVNVYDTKQSRIKTIENQYAEGYHEVIINKADLPESGVFYYEVISSFGREVSKMIILK